MTSGVPRCDRVLRADRPLERTDLQLAPSVVAEDRTGALNAFDLCGGYGAGTIGSWLPHLPVAVVSALDYSLVGSCHDLSFLGWDYCPLLPGVWMVFHQRQLGLGIVDVS